MVSCESEAERVKRRKRCMRKGAGSSEEREREERGD